MTKFASIQNVTSVILQVRACLHTLRRFNENLYSKSNQDVARLDLIVNKEEIRTILTKQPLTHGGSLEVNAHVLPIITFELYYMQFRRSSKIFTCYVYRTDYGTCIFQVSHLNRILVHKSLRLCVHWCFSRLMNPNTDYR